MKRVYIKSHGPLAFSKTVEIGWEDVWLRLHHGRLPIYLAPCLVSREHLKSDLLQAEELSKDKKRTKYDDFYEEEAKTLRAALEAIDRTGYFVDQKPRTAVKGKPPGRRFSLANIYTGRDWINFAEAERMLDFYLSQLGMRNCSYKWKMPRFCVWPTTILSTERST